MGRKSQTYIHGLRYLCTLYKIYPFRTNIRTRSQHAFCHFSNSKTHPERTIRTLEGQTYSCKKKLPTKTKKDIKRIKTGKSNSKACTKLTISYCYDKTHKLNKEWLGSHKILEIKTPNYLLDILKAKPLLTHGNRLKPYHFSRDSPE